MATVTGLSKERMLAIEAASVVDGEVDAAGNLILRTHGGSEFSAGHVKGADGEDASALLSVTDTETVDLTLSGDGTPASPWDLRAQVKDIRPAVERTGLTLVDSVYGLKNNRWYVKGQDGQKYGPYPISKSYIPTPGDKVWLMKDGFGGYVIGGSDDPWLPIPESEFRKSYNARSGIDAYIEPQYQIRNGFTNLRGLAQITISGNGTLIGILPPEARPDHDIIVKINNAGVIRALYIRKTGELTTGSGTTANTYYALDGIMYPAAGRADWTYVGDSGSGLTFANGWGNYPGTHNFGRAGFWRDEYDFIWMTGLISGGSVATNTPMINITNTTFLSDFGQQHLTTVSGETVGGVNVYRENPSTTGAIRCGNGVANNASWMSLGALTYMSYAARYRPEWVLHPRDRAMTGGWTNLDVNNYSEFGYMLRDDGMVLTRGMVANGSLGSTVDYMPREYLTRKYLLLSTTSAQGTFSRINISGLDVRSPSGDILPDSGSTTWISFDMFKWFPG